MDNEFDISILDGLTIEELTAVKARVTELLKGKKEISKEAAKASKADDEAQRIVDAKAKVTVGSTITFTMKGEVRTGKVEKVTEKTATVTLAEGKRYIQFKFITGIETADEAVAA